MVPLIMETVYRCHVKYKAALQSILHLRGSAWGSLSAVPPPNPFESDSNGLTSLDLGQQIPFFKLMCHVEKNFLLGALIFQLHWVI